MLKILLPLLLLAAVALADPIHQAARRGDTEEIMSLLAAFPALIDHPDDRGQTPLHHAVIGNRTATVRLLLAEGATVDPTDRSGQTPLFIALDRGRGTAAVALLQSGARWQRLGDRAVAMAVRADSRQAMSIMIEEGAPVDGVNGEGRTPLAMAVMRGHLNLATLLLEKGADPDVMVGHGTPVICWSAANGRASMVDRLLASGVNLEAVDPGGRNALILAQDHGHPAIAARLEVAGLNSRGTVNDQGYWLQRPVPVGDALFWHLGHCGWAVRTHSHLLVFDYFPPHDVPARPGLANGFLEAEELAGHDVTIFVSHGHRDHFDPAIFALEAIGARFVYGFEPGTPGCGSEQRYTGPDYDHAPPRARLELDGILVETITANDLGVGFLVTVDGVTLYHAGDHAGWREGEKAGFTGEVDYLASLGYSIDAAFLNVTGCHAHGNCPLEDGTQYTLEKLSPTVWFPTHAGGREHVYREFAATIGAQNFSSQITCPSYRGDLFAYHDGQLVQP